MRPHFFRTLLVLFFAYTTVGYADENSRYLMLTARGSEHRAACQKVQTARIPISSIVDQMYSQITISDVDTNETQLQLRVNSLKAAASAPAQIINSDYMSCCQKNTHHQNCNISKPGEKDYHWIGFCGARYGFPVAADVETTSASAN